jgi:hypothetical protein
MRTAAALRDAANTFLHFAAHVPGGISYTIFIHRSVLAGVALATRSVFNSTC